MEIKLRDGKVIPVETDKARHVLLHQTVIGWRLKNSLNRGGAKRRKLG